MDKLRVCIGIRWHSGAAVSEDQATLQAKWMEVYVEASGVMTPGKISDWEAVQGSFTVQGVI